MPIPFFALCAALLILLLLVDRSAMSRRAKTILRGVLTLAAIVVAFQIGFWQGVVLLLAAVAAVELGRLVRRRASAGA
jgi:hypothetical protein